MKEYRRAYKNRHARDKRADNIYHVPKKEWKKWTTVARHVFNKTYEYMMENPEAFRHREDPLRDDLHMKVTAWNAAWIAAGICTRGEKHLLDVIKEEVKDEHV